eukprot:Sspe_Gene.70456::Locus_41599_Transcript_1_1_Confidence_1.000_Length_892::g.70456::m.70456
MGDGSRARQNWHAMLQNSTDPAALVLYDVNRVLSGLLADKPLDPKIGHQIDNLWDLLTVVLQCADRYPQAAQTAVDSFRHFLHFLVKAHNSQPTPQVCEVESRVVNMLYNLAGLSTEAHDAVSSYIPFLLHAAYVQHRSLRQSKIVVFACPPRRMGTRRLSEHDHFIWLLHALLPLVRVDYFEQLLCPRTDDSDFQLAYTSEVVELSLFMVNRLLESDFAGPLNILDPSLKRRAAEPKVVPRKVLTFLISSEDDDEDILPPSYYSGTASSTTRHPFEFNPDT